MYRLFDSNTEVQIYSGCHLPHWYQPGATYFVTFRATDSIPAEVSKRWHREKDAWLERHGISPNAPNWNEKLKELSEEQNADFHERFSEAFLNYLDKGHGECVLQRPNLSAVVGDTLRYFNEIRYNLKCFVVMPNHVHVLVGLKGLTNIKNLCYSWKKYSAAKINKALGRKGRFWQEDNFDHLVRTPNQFLAIENYIARNGQFLPAGTYLYWSK